MDIISYALAKKYTEDTTIGLGALKGAPCTITAITPVGDTGSEVTYEWTANDGVTKQTATMLVKNGVSIESVDVDANNRLIFTMSDGTTITSSNTIGLDVDDIDYTNTKDASVSNVKGALDKLFEKGGSTLENPITSNIAIGSVTKGQTFAKGTSLEDILREILTEKKSPMISLAITPSATLYDEVSDSIDNLKIIATVTKQTNNIKKVEFYVDNVIVKTVVDGVSAGGQFIHTHGATINNDTVIKVVVTDMEGLSSNASKTIKFVGNSYYGVVDASIGEPTEALVKTLNKKLKDVKGFVYSGITTDWGKVCYAYPSEFGKLTSIMDKVNNFNYTSSFQLTTKTIDGIGYYVYTLIDPTGANNVTLTFE